MGTHLQGDFVEPELGTEGEIRGRYDLCATIHKALRLFMADTLTRIGATDHRNEAESHASLAQLRALLDACDTHIRLENAFIHPLIEQARGGASAASADAHIRHERSIEGLRRSATVVANGHGVWRGESMTRLYRELALFIAENFEHMHHEETVQSRVLWMHFTDAELMAAQQAIVGSLAPAEMLGTLQWMIPALCAPERAEMLLGLQAALPPEAFEGVLNVARARLPMPAFAQLAGALGLDPVPGLVQLGRTG